MSRARRVHLGLAFVTLKLHRFEVIAASVAAIAVAAWAVAVRLELDGLGLGADCLRVLSEAVPGETSAACASGIERYIDVLVGRGEDVFRIARLLPFAVGLLVSVPIVGREVEAGTAQTAWSLDASRTRWLRRRIWPIALVVGVAVGIAAIAMATLAGADQAAGRSAMASLGSAGLPLMARLVAALGIGLLVGSLIARTVPALVIGLLLSFALMATVSAAQEAWIRAQEPTIRAAHPEARRWIDTTWAWRAPDGRVLTRVEGRALVPEDLVALDAGSDEEDQSRRWLESRGYERIPMGIPERQATVWYIYDPLLYLGAGALGLVAAFVVVDRRRPTA